MDWHQKLRESLRGKGPFQVKAWGIEYGLLTNAIHYIDLLSYWSDSKVSSVICQFGFHDFYPSKRQGFVEAHGEIFTTFEDGSKLSLRCEKVNVNSTISQGLTLEIKSNVGDWKVDEENGIFIEPSGVITEGKIEFQSQMTGRIVTEILENGRSDLPTLNEVQTSHVLLLDAIQKIWAEKQSESTWAPVT
jgi:predicted dehydrogenase